mgnify:CR=1 FL=1
MLTSKNFDVLRYQFKRNIYFKFSSWRFGEEKAEIDMSDMTIFMKENIRVMSVLNLKEIADNDEENVDFKI